MSNIRQTIIIREDLKLPKGLSEAQVAHLHMEYFRQRLLEGFDKDINCLSSLISKVQFSSDEKEWLKSPYTFVHGVPNIEVLERFKNMALSNGIIVREWRDTVYIKVSPNQQIVVENCLIGITLGPTDSDRIKTAIGDLPLLS